MGEPFHIYNREALGLKIAETAQSHAEAYRRNISQDKDASENETSEQCACAASNTGVFVLSALGYSTDDIKRFYNSQS